MLEENENKHYGKPIRISQELRDFLVKQIVFPESYTECLERLLGLRKVKRNALQRNLKNKKS